jgi:uracil-DNA glycosylase
MEHVETPETPESIPVTQQSNRLESVRDDARSCTACPLWEIGTQTVFGAGPADAKLLFIGEAPGQHEDRTGVPFVGPAGKLFDRILEDAGIDRSTVYVTNTVKHRPWVQSDTGRKKNRAPKQSEIKACAPWLDHELAIVRPAIVCCLGAVAAKRLLGKDFKLTEQRGQWFTTEFAPYVFATIHPSYILIQPPESGDRWLETLTDDLREVRRKLEEVS